MSLLRAAALAALLALVGAPALAQPIALRGGDGSRAFSVARQVLERGTYLRIDRDTTLGPDFRHVGDVVVYDTEVRLEGTIEGTVVVLNGSLFIRPRSRVTGPIAVLGGGAFGSELAEHGEILETSPGTFVSLADGGVTVEGASDEAFVQFNPVKPLISFRPSLPTYDRVNGVTATGGVRLRPQRRDDRPVLDAWVSVFGDREALGGGARLDAPVGEGIVVTAEASRGTRTNDGWQRGDLENTVSTLVFQNDYRDYWESDRYSVTVGRPLRTPLIAGETWLGPRVGVMRSDDRSLRARDVWALFDDADAVRPNTPIDEGTITSVFGGAELHRVGSRSRLRLDAQVEHAVGGDFDFTQLTVDGRYQTVALFRHELRVSWHALAALGSDDPPAQREALLGGRGTIPTLSIGALRGHDLGWVETTYSIPVPAITLPIAGEPLIDLVHVAGSAWRGGASPDWTQNVGVGVRTSVFLLQAFVNPADDDLEPIFVFGFTLPR